MLQALYLNMQTLKNEKQIQTLNLKYHSRVNKEGTDH